jgi:hypothetical protein
MGRAAPTERPEFAMLTPQTLRDSVVNNALAPQLQMMRNAFASSPSKRPEVKVIVAAADVDEARRRVQEYLSQRNVRLEPKYTEAPAPESLSIDVTQQFLGARRQQAPQVKMRQQAPEPAREQTKESAFVPDLPVPAGQDAAKDAEPFDDPARTDALEAAIDPPAEQSFGARLARREVNEFCRGISNEFAGRIARVAEETPDASAPSDPSSFPPVTIGDWSGLFPWLAKSESSAAAQERRLGFAPPAHEPNADEEVDVLIVVRPDAELLLQQQQRAVTQDVAAPMAEDQAPPTTTPATSPSAQE